MRAGSFLRKEVAERTATGEITQRRYTIDRLPKELMRQVFDYRRIRPFEEQKKLPPEPVNAVRCHPADLAAITAQAAELIETLQDESTGRTAKKKAAKQLCEAAGRLAGFFA